MKWHLALNTWNTLRCALLLLSLSRALAPSTALGAPAEEYRVKTVAPNILQVGEVTARTIDESSGLVASRQYKDVFWTHNDKGNRPVLFAITRQGRLLTQFKVAGAAISDWEDLAVDDHGMLYLADTGNNQSTRKEVAVHRVSEPDPHAPESTVQIQQTWTLTFPGAPFDSESLFVHRGNGYLISKMTQDRQAEIYRFPLRETNAPIVLEAVARLPVTSPVASADLSPDGALLGLVCKSGAYVFKIDGDVAQAGTATPVRTKFKFDGIEGCAFVSDGLLAIAETREIFLFNDPAYRWLSP